MASQVMKPLKIGYHPLTSTLSAAGDRRRLLFWAKNRGHEIVLDPTKKVDVIVASEKSDFQSTYLTQTKIPVVFDLVDAYLSPLNTRDDYVRGLAKKLSGQISGSVKSFSHYIRDFCILSAAVICSSPEQEALIQPFNHNTHVILDSHDEISFVDPKIAKSNAYDLKTILWEGQPATIRGVGQLSSILFQLTKEYDLKFDFVTDEEYFQFLGKYFKRRTSHLLRKDLSAIFDRVSVTPWSPDKLVAVANKCTIAMIPIDLTVPMQKLKPENRLLIMWRLGLPCLTSPSPAYARVAKSAGVQVVCDSPEAWLDNFSNLLNDTTFAHEEVLRGQAYLRSYHNRETLLNKWDQAIESVIG